MTKFVFWDTPAPILRAAAPIYAELAAARMQLCLAKIILKAGFDPNQSRLPKGVHGGGRWADNDNGVISGADSKRLAANASKKPPVVLTIPMSGVDPIDPKILNKPPIAGEWAEVQKSLNDISKMDADALAAIGKNYNNYPDRQTGAVLPPSTTGYMSFPVGGSRSSSARRIVIDTATGAVYYTNNHYLSFYHWNLMPK